MGIGFRKWGRKLRGEGGQQVEKLSAVSSRNTCCMGVGGLEGDGSFFLQQEPGDGKVSAALMRISQLSCAARGGVEPPSAAHLSML